MPSVTSPLLSLIVFSTVVLAFGTVASARSLSSQIVATVNVQVIERLFVSAGYIEHGNLLDESTLRLMADKGCPRRCWSIRPWRWTRRDVRNASP
jgi:hypothetical protein